jgi:hypothetical protein
MAARTENGRNAFLVDLEKESKHEDQHQLRMVLRAAKLTRPISPTAPTANLALIICAIT